METGCNRAFTLPDHVLAALTGGQRDQWVRRRIRGIEVEPYRLRPPSRWLLHPHAADQLDDLPAPLSQHLEQHWDALRARAAFKRGDCLWWKYTWPLHAARYAHYRVITPYRSATHRFAVVGPGEGIGLTDTTSIFVSDEEHADAVAALLMSAPVVDRFGGLTKHTGGAMMEFFENQLREVPLPEGWDALVPTLARHGRALAGAPEPSRAAALQQQIDATLGVAYGLS
jgi:hypothetical protein